MIEAYKRALEGVTTTYSVVNANSVDNSKAGFKELSQHEIRATVFLQEAAYRLTKAIEEMEKLINVEAREAPRGAGNGENAN